MRGSTTGWLRRLTSDEGELEAAELSLDTAAAGADRVADCRSGAIVNVRGKLRMVQFLPPDGLCALIAELYDGTDAVELIWLGRRAIPGIEAGRPLCASGRVALRDGRKAIYNPHYRLLPVGE